MVLTKFVIFISMRFTRICPDCHKKLFHTAQNNRDRLAKLQRPCVKCGRIRMMNATGYWGGVEKVKQILHEKFSGKGNPNFGIPMSEKQKDKLRKNAKILRGKDNLSYGKSPFQWWVEKYGVEVAQQKLHDLNHKQSLAASGERNSMYGKPSPQGSGNGWSGWYKGWYFRSIHELSYMINVIEKNGLGWENAEQKKFAIPYADWEGKQRTYFADFVIDGKLMVECKPTRLHHSIAVKSKQMGAIKFCARNNLTYRVECPILLTIDEMKSLYAGGKIKFLPRYEKMFLDKYGRA